MSLNLYPHIPSSLGEPAWEAAMFFPPQGQWNECDFLRFHTNRMAELVAGRLEILPMPSWIHQLIVKLLIELIEQQIRANELGGVLLFAPLPTRLFPGTIREPDVLYVAPENVPKLPIKYPDKIDFAIEVVSEGEEARRRDYEQKRVDYARAGVAEYWIVDPEDELITVLSLRGDAYELIGEYRSGDVASGHYFSGFSVDVNQVLALGRD